VHDQEDWKAHAIASAANAPKDIKVSLPAAASPVR